MSLQYGFFAACADVVDTTVHNESWTKDLFLSVAGTNFMQNVYSACSLPV